MKGKRLLTQGVKYDEEKLRWDLLPMGPIKEVIKVLMFGAKKYADDNWKYVEDARRRYYSASLRHITAWWDGEENDEDSKLSHLAHAICCLVFLLYFKQEFDRKNTKEGE